MVQTSRCSRSLFFVRNMSLDLTKFKNKSQYPVGHRISYWVSAELMQMKLSGKSTEITVEELHSILMNCGAKLEEEQVHNMLRRKIDLKYDLLTSKVSFEKLVDDILNDPAGPVASTFPP